MFKVLFAILFFVFTNPVWAAPQDTDVLGKVRPSYKPQVGQAHSDFVLPSIEDGSNIQLSDYRGKKVLLLHFASW